jgi:serine/threonine protein kinase
MLEHLLLGLRYLNRKVGIIHTDIKPHNILKMDDGTYCLTDLGIVRIKESKK